MPTTPVRWTERWRSPIERRDMSRRGWAPRVLIGRLQNTRGDLAGAIDNLESLVFEWRCRRQRPGPELSRDGARAERPVRRGDRVLERAAASCRAAGLLRPMFNATYFAGIVRASVGRSRGCARGGDAGLGRRRAVRASRSTGRGRTTCCPGCGASWANPPGRSTTPIRPSRRRVFPTASSKPSQPPTPGSNSRSPPSSSATTPRRQGGSPTSASTRSTRSRSDGASTCTGSMCRRGWIPRVRMSCSSGRRARIGEVPVACPRSPRPP